MSAWVETKCVWLELGDQRKMRLATVREECGVCVDRALDLQLRPSQSSDSFDHADIMRRFVLPD